MSYIMLNIKYLKKKGAPFLETWAHDNVNLVRIQS